MKLILCTDCTDIVKLHTQLRTCLCGKSYGRYLNDGHTATYGGKAIPLGILNSSLELALSGGRQLDAGFEGFVFNENALSFKKVS